MKKSFKTAISLLLAAVMVFGISVTAFAESTDGITVNGRGIVSVEPDTATIYANIETRGTTASQAQEENNKVSSAVISSMKKAGIAEDRILTEYSYVSPYYDYDNQGKRSEQPVYFRAYTTLSFATSDVENAGAFIDTALKAGATGSDISFSLENSSVYYAQALTNAIKTAGDSAAVIAESYGRSLGPVKSVVETSSNNYTTETSGMAKSVNAEMADYDAGEGSTVINYDKIDITARVTVTYSFN